MKRILFAVAAVVVTAAGARADWGATPAPQPPAGAPVAAGGGSGEYGWNPVFKRCLWWKKDSGCKNCGGHGGAGGMGGAAAGGTLVFPQHPYARSPRDWFMTGY
jgi:hypothetical protein